MRYISRLSVAALALALACGSAFSEVKPVTKGSFLDSSGARHTWTINQAHAIWWDDQPYLPVGVGFTPAYFTDQTDTAWQADVKSLEAIRGKGLSDVLIRAGVPATSVAAEAWQRVIDYLDQQGLAYGVELDDGPSRQAAGFVVCPRVYKYPSVPSAGVMELNLPRARGGFYIIADSILGEVIESGAIRPAGDRVVLNIRSDSKDSSVLVVFPLKNIVTNRGSLPDLWQGYDESRDRLMDFFGQVKFGKGLRFFLDPFAGGAAPVGETVSAIPDSASYRLQFEGWLSQKYADPETLFSAWGAAQSDTGTFEQAARLIPLWWDGKGVPYAYDRASARYVGIDVPKSTMWRDILDFRDSSIQEYMNSAADTLRRCVADVPVVFSAGSFHRVFANALDNGGFNGLSASISSDSESDTTLAGETYALALDSAQTTWFLGLDDALSDPADSVTPLLRLKDLGAKGFFRVSSSPSGVPLEAAAEFRKRLGSSAVEYTPDVLFYPRSIAYCPGVKKLDFKTWWLPTLRSGDPVQFGDNVFGYMLPADMLTSSEPASTIAASGKQGTGVAESYSTCLWSNGQPATVTAKLRGQTFSIPAMSRSSVQLPVKKDVLKLSLSDSPTVITGMTPDDLFPIEIVQSEIDLLEKSIIAAQRGGMRSAGSVIAVDQAKRNLRDQRPSVAFNTAAQGLRALVADSLVYLWIEGESTQDYNFDGPATLIGSSGARYLKLSSSEEAPVRPYAASYSFTLPLPATYEVWLAAAAPGQSGVSNLLYSIDGARWQDVTPAQQSQPYADNLSWFKIGSADLTAGTHNLAIRPVRTGLDAPYYAAIDVVVLSRKPFTPDGIRKPPPLLQ